MRTVTAGWERPAADDTERTLATTDDGNPGNKTEIITAGEKSTSGTAGGGNENGNEYFECLAYFPNAATEPGGGWFCMQRSWFFVRLVVSCDPYGPPFGSPSRVLRNGQRTHSRIQ